MESRAASKPPAIRIRRARPDDVPGIYACQRAAYADTPDSGLCDERLLHMQVDVFPEGQLVAVAGKAIVGYAMSLIVQLDEQSPWYSYDEITGGGTFNTHDPAGDTLYGADIAVHPDWRGRGVAGRLYDSRRKILKRFNLAQMVAGGRIPGYALHAGRMTPEEYVAAVQRGELHDMALNAHLKAGYRVLGVHMSYLRDEQSLDYATHLALDNPEYRATKRRIAASPMRRPVRTIRVCAAQFQMRRISSWEEFAHQVDFFVETADEYHCHYLLFPELFTVQLFTTLPDGLTSRESIAALADLTDRYRELLSDRAKRSNLYIIGGSHPVRTDEGIFNVAHLFTPAGDIYTQDKLHITPDERDEFGIRPGRAMRVFHTSHARIAIQVCYDVEFPEIARLQTLAGAEVLFVPFSTDERKAYNRVRYTAQARAVENQMYVVTAGNVGNLPQVANFLINYGQAAVYTPSDFPFPPDAIAAISDTNSEAVVITDLDLSTLEQVREVGTVRHLRDRRRDLYQLRAAEPVEVVPTS
ncbi:GNAT family N-acetyltransferase [bacterium]|nr:GNAT family N-acetyltransferase [bacterium]